MIILVAMEYDGLIAEVETYCARAGMMPSTLAVKVLGNSRFFDRLNRKVTKADEDAARLRAFMLANPPPIPAPLAVGAAASGRGPACPDAGCGGAGPSETGPGPVAAEMLSSVHPALPARDKLPPDPCGATGANPQGNEVSDAA